MKKYIALIFLTINILVLTGCHSIENPDPETSADSQTAYGNHETSPSPHTDGQASVSPETSAPASSTLEPSDPVSSGPDSSAPENLSSISTPATSGALHVDGTQLTDEKGQPIQLKGISTHGLAWFPDYVNEDCFRQLREEWNANAIRLAMYTEESGGYCSGGDQEALKELVKKGVDYATDLDLYVIIDWHILSDGNPNRHLLEAKGFFTEMAELYADHNNVLYEICNEPNGNTSWNDIKAYAEEIIPAIRSLDQDAIIIVGTPNWSQYVDQAAADPITGYDNIMYALHFYAATHKDPLRDTMTAAIDAGLPVFVSEYGICDASGNGAIDEAQADQWVRTMDEYGVSYMAWNLSNKNESSAILKNTCTKTSGFTQDDLSNSGKWLYQMLTSAMNQTDHLPAENSQQNQTSGSPDKLPAETPQQSQASGNSQTAMPQNSAAAENTAGSPVPTLSLVNSWESGGQSFYQYELTLTNTSGTDYTQWTVDLPFDGSITLSDSWNGEYSVSGENGNVLHITNKDYNGSIASGGSVGNIGFIISK